MTQESEIKKDLINQLEKNGVHGNHYLDMANDYMCLWAIKNKLIEDINERGVSVMYQNGASQSGYKKNDSISELNKTNGQMLKILNELGLRATSTLADDKDDVEM